MLKNIRIEILIIVILFLNIFFSNNLGSDFYKHLLIFKNSPHQVYLKEFFENITILGDSMLYFAISIISIIVFFLLRKSNFFNNNKTILKKIQYYNLLLFSSILVSGILTQLIKHALGRPRPGTLVNEGFALKFFTFDSSFHSFPSGHTSTIFSVALVMTLMAPKLKYLL